MDPPLDVYDGILQLIADFAGPYRELILDARFLVTSNRLAD